MSIEPAITAVEHLTHWVSPCRTVLIINADCLDVLPLLPAGCVDALVTDPPYGISHKSNGQWFRQSHRISGDESTQVAEAIVRATASMQQVVFFSPHKPLQVAWRSVLVWSKGEHVGIGGDRATCWKRDAEFIGVRNNLPLNGQRDSCVIAINALSPPPSGHFCEKPLRLMQYLVGKLNTRSVIDPCCGSGATGHACVTLGRSFIGVESDPKWFRYTVSRIERAICADAKRPDGTVQKCLDWTCA